MDFNANNIPPQQGFGGHPAGMHDFSISNTSVQQTKSGDGGMFIVEFTSPVGRIINRYNLWNKAAQAVEISKKELSALCHAVGIFQLSFPETSPGSGIPDINQPQGAQLRGGRGRMLVGPQDGNEQYSEVKRVFDIHGNEPGATPPGQQGQQAGAGGGWGGTQTQPNKAADPAPGAAGGWSTAPGGAPAGGGQPVPWGTAR